MSLSALSLADFIALCYHEVERDGSGGLTRTAVTAGDLAAQFAWLQANGYRPVSLQQILQVLTATLVPAATLQVRTARQAFAPDGTLLDAGLRAQLTAAMAALQGAIADRTAALAAAAQAGDQ